MEANFWDDRKKAQSTISANNRLKDIVETYEKLVTQMSEYRDVLEELRNGFDQEMYDLVEQEATDTMVEYNDFETKVLLSNEYDIYSAIVEIHPGAGGTESQDWAEMLYRMYTRWANRHDFKVTVIDYQDGDEAGLKSVTFEVEGDYAYGLLLAEKGVHRLVRISPFDSSGRRHTSFSSVDVMPKLSDEIDIELDPNDLIIDTHRSSGAGGQHVNKTDSAVRITHKPTGIMVHVQNERSQMQNREQALNLIKSKLYQLKIEEQLQKISDIKGEQKQIEWGSQIRSYVFMPYTLVKDNRTNYEQGNVEAVMDGDIDGFIQAYLKSKID